MLLGEIAGRACLLARSAAAGSGLTPNAARMLSAYRPAVSVI
jgi:hypothetical protein